MGFGSFGLPPSLLAALGRIGYENPTAVQSLAMPLALAGRDVFGASATGSGKTAAFLIPLAAKLLNARSGCGLVIAPTRELAHQIFAFAKKLLSGQEIALSLLVGGEDLHRQVVQLKKRSPARLVVGTPGRIYDHARRGSLVLSGVNFLVLDEADLMLDMGFVEQVDAIVESLPKERQTMMFSATVSAGVERWSKNYMNNPELARAGGEGVPAANIKQEVITVSSREEKCAALMKELDKREGSIIVFVKTKIGAAELTATLQDNNYSADCVHGDLRQSKRNRTIKGFRNRVYKVMVATDVASRGLDIPHVEHVINYDLPQSYEDYVHRIGRTARAGASGSALVFVTPADRAKWRVISNVLSGGSAFAPPKLPAESNPRNRVRSRFGKPSYGNGGGGKSPYSTANKRSSVRNAPKQRTFGAPRTEKRMPVA